MTSGREGAPVDVITFTAEVWQWRGPAPYYFLTVPEPECVLLRDVAEEISYGWGMVPVRVRLGDSEWETSLWPKDGGYVLPLRAVVRRAEGLEEGEPATVRLTPAPRDGARAALPTRVEGS